jgi:MoxR-like ATPase
MPDETDEQKVETEEAQEGNEEQSDKKSEEETKEEPSEESNESSDSSDTETENPADADSYAAPKPSDSEIEEIENSEVENQEAQDEDSKGEQEEEEVDEESAQRQAAIDECAPIISAITESLGLKVIGQEHLRRRLLNALIADGHVLLEGVPGLAKTLSIKALAESVDGSFQRVQFTPDLLPADLIGTEVYRHNDQQFVVRKGPVFANFVLADEINRAPAKVQSALLETMQERQVTIGQETFPVPQPYFVLATQNPIEQEGTYPLPEAQIDRFLMKVKVSYPTSSNELEMLGIVTQPDFDSKKLEPVVSLDDIRKLRNTAEMVYVDDRVKRYIVDLVAATRAPADFDLDLSDLIELGASPRASIALFLCSRAEALLEGEAFVVPQHVKDVAVDVLRHRIIPTYEAEAQGLTSDDLVEQILDGVPVP